MRQHRLRIEVAVDVIREGAGRGVAPTRFGFERSGEHIVDVTLECGSQCRARKRQQPQVGAQFSDPRRGTTQGRLKLGSFTKQKLMQQDAKRIDVGCRGDHAAGVLLGSCIARRQRDIGTARGALFLIQQLGNAEIQQLGISARVYQNVRRLDVAMDNECAMGGIHSMADGDKQAQSRAQVELLLNDMLTDGHAVDVLHDQVGNSGIGDATIDQVRDVRMREICQGLALASKQALLQFGIEAAAQEFHRNALLEITARALAEEHRRHASLTKQTQQAKPADPRSDQAIGLQVNGIMQVLDPLHRRPVQQPIARAFGIQHSRYLVDQDRIGAMPGKPIPTFCHRQFQGCFKPVACSQQDVAHRGSRIDSNKP
ncbi:MAG: hypothetical protein BWZ07_03087 [Alphaproteobacteria bacterium ADurb.BinA280]|nr:MAG: hypothetical protein BWZ07_03087 [Alphaproteobacteria bacterium ADurb.BinA280]